MECLEREAPKVLSMQRESETAPFEWRLISCLNKGDFESAQKWFHDSVLLDLRDELKQGFLEIKYRLYKLEVLSCAKSQSLKEASELIKEKLLPLVKAWKKEFPDCGGKLRTDVTAFENQLRSSTILPDYSISIEFLLSDELGPDLYMTSSDARGVFSAICSLYDHDYKLIDEEISLEYVSILFSIDGTSRNYWGLLKAVLQMSR
ncbi:hypothetical protein BC829DRAFT_243890 [Chytridium lagenaria]|nr:hypothetical protein BC829DRAFT_243890 [Chytridium lagenaria]